jgi:methyl-accepting chemotaxis protein
VNTSQELSRLQGRTAHSSSGHRLTGIEAGPFRQNGIQGKPATPPSARPPSHSTSTSTARAGWFENLHLRHKMVLGLSVLAIAGLALAAVAYNTIQKVKIGGSSYAEIVVWKDLNADILRPPLYIIDMHRTVLAMAAETDQPESGKGQALREQFALLRKDYDERHRHWGSTLATGNMRQALLVESHAPVEAFVKAYDTQFLPLVLKREHQKSTEVALGVLTNEFEKHRVALDKAVQIGRREQAQIEQAASGTVSSSIRMLIGFVITAGALAGVLGLVLTRSIARPLARMSEELKLIDEGRRDVRLTATTDNEAGQIARAFNSTLDTIQANAEALQVEMDKNNMFESMSDNSPANVIFAGDDLRIRYVNPAATSTLKTLQFHLPVSADRIYGQSADFFHKDLADSRGMLNSPQNLPRAAQVRFGPETLDLQVSPIYDKDKNYLGAMITFAIITEQLAREKPERDMTANIKRVMEKVAQNATTLGSASEELAANSQQMVSNAEETATLAGVVSAAAEQVSKNVQTVATGTEEMGASIKEIAKSVQDAAKVAATAVRAAETTNATISKLGDSSAEIGKVIKVITSIAQQTNLLALNATIEAARAGEAGKGFAVVANEVKELAKETAKATEYISQKIEAIQSETKMAVDAIAEIGTVINKISDYQNTIASAVEEQTATTNEISRNVTEAARGSTEIAQNITGVATSARSTSAGAHDTQKAAGELSRMAAELQSIVTLHGS